jgi:predicted RNA-binding protein with PIN domain
VTQPTLVVDAMNVIGSRPNGWWRDRGRAIRRFVESLQLLAAADELALIVVIDGRPLPDLPEGDHGSVQVLYASRRGPNAADDRIIELIQASPNPTSLEVVTSDRALSQRSRDLAATVSKPTSLLEKLDALTR